MLTPLLFVEPHSTFIVCLTVFTVILMVTSACGLVTSQEKSLVKWEKSVKMVPVPIPKIKIYLTCTYYITYYLWAIRPTNIPPKKPRAKHNNTKVQQQQLQQELSLWVGFEELLLLWILCNWCWLDPFFRTGFNSGLWLWLLIFMLCWLLL